MTEAIEATVVALARNVTTELAAANPKDTGWSSVNWIPSIGKPAKRGGPGFDRALRSREAKLALVPFETAAQQGAIREVGSFRLRMRQIFITNYVDYVKHLDAGSSPKAPRGWVRIAIEVGIGRTVLIHKTATVLRA